MEEKKQEKKQKKQKKQKKGINVFSIILIIVAIIIIAIVAKKNNIFKGKSENNSNTEISESEENSEENVVVNEEFTQSIEDGTKINVGSKINEERTVAGLKFTNFQLTEKDNQSTLLADVENTSGKDINDYTTLNIKFLAKDGKEIVTIQGLLVPLKAGATTQLNANVTQDIANAFDLEITESK